MTQEVETVVEGATEPIAPSVDPTPTVETPTQAEPVQAEPVAAVPAQPSNDQVSNLNIALQKEREARREESEKFKADLEIAKSANAKFEKMSEIFNPKPQTEPEAVAQPGLTAEEVEAIMVKRDAERAEDVRRESEASAIKEEVTKMEKQWDGADGKPKYEDKEVLQWQEDNKRLHLSPREAFDIMNRDSILDYELKQRMKKAPPAANVEVPGGAPTSANPIPTKPDTDKGLRNAVLEAMQIASGDNSI